MKTNDLRVVKTLQLIQNTFYNLVQYKRVNKITVTELCSLAQISKGTFYHYYLDIYDLYEKTMCSFIQNTLDSIDYYDLYFSDTLEFYRRFRQDTEFHIQSNKLDMYPEYEPFFDSYWVKSLEEKILEYNQLEKIFGHPLTEKQLLTLKMIIQCDIQSFKRWPDKYPLVQEVVARWVQELKSSN